MNENNDKKHVTGITSYLEKIINIPSPTGYTEEIISFLIKNAEEKGISYQKTKKGSVYYIFESKNPNKKIIFAAHVDTLGAMVREVTEKAVRLTNLGGFPLLYVIGEYCTVHTNKGKIKGTILPDNPSSHVNKKIDETKLTIENIQIRIDEDIQNKKIIDSIRVGDFVSFSPRFEENNGYIKSRHLDDKASSAVLLQFAEELAFLNKSNKTEIKNSIYLYFNITEETGQGISLLPDAEELIIVDMGTVGDGVNGSEHKVSICAKDSSGPYNYEITQKLIQCAEKNNVDYCIDVFPYYGSDGSAALRAGHDMRVGLCGPGVAGSHGMERTHTNALINTYKLITTYSGV